MIDYKTVLGAVAVLVALIGYIPYFRNIYLKRTKPHAFSWLVWSLLTGIAFFAQLLDRGGAGAWVTGFTALVSTVIFGLALKKGEKDITISDKLSLIGAGIALPLWYLTNSPLTSVILISIIDAFGYYPTFRKSFYKPHEETALTFFLGGLKFLIGIVALRNYSIVTWLYPSLLVIMNFTFVVMILVRRKQHRSITIAEHGF